MTAPRRVLVVGGGAAGNATAILLRRAGLAVDLIEAKDDWNATAGSGITLQGNALRVLRELGVWDQVAASGFGFDAVGLTAPDGTVLLEAVCGTAATCPRTEQGRATRLRRRRTTPHRRHRGPSRGPRGRPAPGPRAPAARTHRHGHLARGRPPPWPG
ncbi:hypothetical protein SFUMM280S_08208 [Streptomyces fumanus]